MGTSRWEWLALGALPLVALALIGPVLGAGLAPIDDHQIPFMLDLHARMSWPDVFAAMNADPLRVRPFYWVVRTAEVAGWGMKATGWYLDRLVLLVVTLIAAAAVALRYVGSALAAIAAILVVVGPQAESWYRLGPQESIATPLLLGGLALIAWARPRPGLALLILAALTKEAFVPFAFTATALAWPRRSAIASSAIVAAIGVLVILASAGNLYAQPRSLADLLGEASWMTAADAPILAIAVVAVILGWRPQLRWLAIAIALVGTEAFLYAGVTAGRYLLPVELVVIAGGVAGLAAVARIRPRVALTLGSVAAIVVVAQLVVGAAGAARWAASTTIWAEDLERVRSARKSHPSATLVVVPIRASDAEPIEALRRFIPEGQAMLAPSTPTWSTSFEAANAEALARFSQSGGLGYAPWRPSPDCIQVAFGPAPTFCPVDLKLPRVP